MSGAEAAGLALGVIALASLFKSCVELLEWFELGKNYRNDYRLACIKIGVLSKRLSVWGGHVQILNRGCEHPFLFNSAIHGIVSDSLKSLESLLSDTDGLRRRYDLTTVTHPSIGTRTPTSPTKLAFWPLQIRKRTTWSIRDKAKFDRFIGDVSFFMDNLEKATVTERVGYLNLVRESASGVALVRKPTIRTDGMLVLRKEEESRGNLLLMSDGDESRTGSSDKTVRNDDVGTRADINNCRQTTSDNAVGFQGTSGESGGHATIRDSEQINKGHSKGAQGALGKDAFSLLMASK